MPIRSLRAGVANAHIIAGPKGVVVIDAGMPGHAQHILNAVHRLGRSPEDVRLILLTHGHIDHAGSALALKRLTRARIALHSADAALVATPDLKVPPGRGSTFDALARLLRYFGWLVPLETFAPDIWLDELDSLHDFGIDGRVIHTPGHTAGSVTLLLGDGTAFVGDAILNAVRVSFPAFWEDGAAAYASACLIQSLRPHTLYTGHGRPFDLAALDAFIARLTKG
ncbi:MAG: MBL fold metallo-hydrolase [Chloroflexi bacterium]|nr:MBL fold metallo-hydrolase [Chloroflexota bacterium]